MVSDCGTKEDIMEATYRALCTHGYAALSIEKIADEMDKEKSVIYYHYDDKEDLLTSFLQFMQRQIREQRSSNEGDPEQRLDHFLDMALGTADQDLWEFRQALFELQSDAPYKEAFAQEFKEIHRLLEDKLADILDDMGVENSNQKAEDLFYRIEGAAVTKITEDDRDALTDIRSRLKSEFIDGA